MKAARPNEDVLALVCDCLTDVPDVLSSALTCSALRPAATTRLLSMWPIGLTAGASVRWFHSFLFADTPARAPHVCALWIDLESNERRADAEIARDAALLFNILTVCPHLERVSLVFERYSAGDPDNPRIRDALAALPNLCALTLYGLPTTRSPSSLTSAPPFARSASTSAALVRPSASTPPRSSNTSPTSRRPSTSSGYMS